MVKVTVIMDGEPISIDRELLPKDSNGREYDYIINELDENGLYKIDTNHYDKKAKEDAIKGIEDWFNKKSSILNEKYTQYEIALFPTLEEEAKQYINGGIETRTPYLDYILLNRADNKYKSKLELSNAIIEKAQYRREVILCLVVERKNRIHALN